MGSKDDKAVIRGTGSSCSARRGGAVRRPRLFFGRLIGLLVLVVHVLAGHVVVAGDDWINEAIAKPAEANQTWASEDRLVTVGVLTITSKQEALGRWNATADYLSQHVPGTRFEIRPLYLQEVDRALRQGELDFVHLQPLQFVQMRRQFQLRALATRVVDATDDGLTSFGSAIVRRRDRKTINELSDLRGAIVAGVAPNALGAWILGMEEIERAGLSVQDDILPLFVGLPMTNVLGAVDAGRADAGVVRADVLERAIASGMVDPDAFTVLNPVRDANYPYRLSTRLVPEWPFAAARQTDPDIVEQVAAALLALPRESAPLTSAGLVGWSEPVSYDGLEPLADRWLKPPQSFGDWLHDHWWTVLVGVSLLLAVLLGQQWHARRQLAERERVRRAALHAMHDAVVTLDAEGRIHFMNSAAHRLLTPDMPPERALGRPFLDAFALLLRDDRDDFSLGGLYESLASEGVARDSVVLAHGQPRRILDLHAVRMDNLARGPIGEVLVSMTDVTELEEANRELRFQASHDQMTGLLNRRRFIEVIDQHRRGESGRGGDGGILLWVDLDHFRLVNEGSSHQVGDALIRRIASYFSVLLPARTPIGRLGDDEFGIFLSAASVADRHSWPNRLLVAIREFRLEEAGLSLQVTASIGSRVLPADGSLDGTTALEEAESACTLAKDLGGNRLVGYHEDDNERRLRQADYARLSRLKQALQDNRFSLFAQEIHSVSSESSGPWLEVLLRLESSEGGFESPGPMIELAERFNYMPRVDRWVIRNALETLNGYRDTGRNPPACLAINLSAQSLKDAELARYVRQELERNHVHPGWICFEITETAAIANFDQALELVGALRDLGCQIALDDFGSGLLSFDFLRRLRPDIVKIDGRLVRDLSHDPVATVIVESIHSVARVMHAKTVGEWVETDEIGARLVRIGVDFAQGYLLHRPDELSRYLRERRVRSRAN